MLLKNIAYSSLRQIINIGMGFAATMLLARALGPEKNGEFVSVLFLISVMVSFISLGTGNYSLFATGKISDTELQKKIFQCATFCSAVGIPVVILISWWENWSYFGLIVFLSIILGIYNQACLCFLQAKGDLKAYNIVSLFSPMFLFLAAVLLTYFTYSELAWLGFLIGEFSVFLGLIYFSRKYSEKFEVDEIDFFDYLKNAFSYGWKTQGMLFFTLLLYRGILGLIDLKLGATAVGIFAVALTVIEKSALLSQSLSLAVFKEMKNSKLMSKNRLNRLAFYSFGLTLIAGILIINIFSIISSDILGKSYDNIDCIMWFLIPGISAFGAGRIYLNYFLANGKLNGLIPILGVILALSAVIAIPILEQYGVLGAAGMTSFAFVFFTIFLSYRGISGE
jgi:O-antigen/teichoic acid export membrane protein